MQNIQTYMTFLSDKYFRSKLCCIYIVIAVIVLNKKLRYHKEHSASVVLSWCTFDISRKKIR